MVDVKTEERHAHEHEILLGKYENGNDYANIWTQYPKICYFETMVAMSLLVGFCATLRKLSTLQP